MHIDLAGEAATLEGVLGRLDAAVSLDEVVQIARVEAHRLLKSQGVTFVVREDDKCFYLDEDAIAPLWKGQRFPINDCISGWSMINRETAVIPDIQVDPRIPQKAYRSTFVRSLLMVPIRRSDPLGAMGAYWADIHYASESEIATLERIAEAVAEAISRIGLDDAPWAPTFQLADDSALVRYSG